MFKYVLDNVYELVSRATLLALAIAPATGTYDNLLFEGDFSGWLFRAILAILALGTAKPLAKFSAAVGAVGFSYLYTDQAIAFGGKILDFVTNLF